MRARLGGTATAQQPGSADVEANGGASTREASSDRDMAGRKILGLILFVQMKRAAGGAFPGEKKSCIGTQDTPGGDAEARGQLVGLGA
jgi:hypothetical protein